MAQSYCRGRIVKGTNSKGERETQLLYFIVFSFPYVQAGHSGVKFTHILVVREARQWCQHCEIHSFPAIHDLLFFCAINSRLFSALVSPIRYCSYTVETQSQQLYYIASVSICKYINNFILQLIFKFICSLIISCLFKQMCCHSMLNLIY